MKRNSAYFLLECLVVLLTAGCAQVRSVSGGELDTAPPVVLSSPHLMTNWSGSSFDIEFDEYVQVNNPRQQLLVSPPLNQVQVKATPKGIRVSWNDTLRANTTYVFNFGDCIADIHENNILSNYVCAFSTGAQLDSCSTMGLAKIAEKDSLASNIRIIVHENDSAYRLKGVTPLYMGRTNEQGAFAIPYMRPGQYVLSAVGDVNNNARWDEGEMMSLPMKIHLPDTNAALLFLSTPLSRSQTGVSYRNTNGIYISAKVPHHLYLTASTTNQNDTLHAVRDLDSLYWDMRGTKGDEVYFQYSNGITDTLSINNKLSERFPVITHAPSRIGISDSLCLFSPLPLDSVNGSALVVMNDTLEVPSRTKIRDRQFISIQADWKAGEKYSILGQRGCFNAAGLASDSIQFTVEVLSDKTSGGIRVQLDSCMTQADTPLILQVVSKNGRVVKAQTLHRLHTVDVPQLEMGDYRILLIYDEDRNGAFTPCNPNTSQQAERVVAYGQGIQIRPNWTTTITWQGCR